MTHTKTILQIVYCCWLAFELVFVYIFVVETKNLSLEETAALFDGDDVQSALGTVVAELRNGDVKDEKDSDSLPFRGKEKV